MKQYEESIDQVGDVIRSYRNIEAAAIIVAEQNHENDLKDALAYEDDWSDIDYRNMMFHEARVALSNPNFRSVPSKGHPYRVTFKKP